MKLCEMVAINKSRKSQLHKDITELHRLSNNTSYFNGMNKTYEPLKDDGEGFPPDNKKVQYMVKENIDAFYEALKELFNMTATIDFGNLDSTADVKIDDAVLIKDAPIPYLLFLEKQLNDIRTFIENLPILSNDENWIYDNVTELYKTEPTKKQRTSKIQKPIVLYDATDRHPAQTQLITEDCVVGHWTTVLLSSALPKSEIKRMLKRLNQVLIAVKSAREIANSQTVEKQDIADNILNYIFK